MWCRVTLRAFRPVLLSAVHERLREDRAHEPRVHHSAEAVLRVRESALAQQEWVKSVARQRALLHNKVCVSVYVCGGSM